jgi:hypothetical protein
MANGSSRFLAVLISLVIGFAVGWFIHAPAPPPPPSPTPTPMPITPSPRPPKATPIPVPTAGDWDITIGDDPCKLTDPKGSDAYVQAVEPGQNRIKWHAKGLHLQDVYVVLEVPDCPPLGSDPPFEKAILVGSSPNGKSLWMIGPGKNIDSGKANAKLCPSDPSNGDKCIKYTQFIKLSDGWHKCDGWIIVKG